MFNMQQMLTLFFSLHHCWGRWGEIDYCTASDGCGFADPNVQTRWMAKIPDNVKIYELSLPGTHDSMARRGGQYVECQSMSLQRQLEVGIRAFDIRNRRTGDSFAIHHGVVYQGMMFGSGVVEVMTNFLNANPTETIIMHHQEEHTPQSGSQSYSSIMNRYKGIYDKLWELTSNSQAQGLTLGDARGKILINWDTRISREIQNRWNVQSCSALDTKKRALKNNINNARNNPHGVKLYMNYLSGNGGSKALENCFKFSCGCLFIKDIAKTCNNEAFNALVGLTSIKRVGMILADFPGPNLIREIIRQNYFKCPTYREKSYSRGVVQSCQTHFKALRSGDTIALRAGCGNQGWLSCWKNPGHNCRGRSCPGGSFSESEMPRCFGEQFVIVAEGRERGEIIWAGDKVGLYYRDNHWLSCQDTNKNCITRPCPGRLSGKFNSNWDWNDGCAWETFRIERAWRIGREVIRYSDDVMFRRSSRSCDDRHLSLDGNKMTLRQCPGCTQRFGTTWHYRTCSCERFRLNILRWW